MNFKEFEELINSGAEEIVLTEDIFISDEDNSKSFEISLDVDNLIIDGNNHTIESVNCEFEIRGDNITFKNIN